jgi:heptosyltransferase II
LARYQNILVIQTAFIGDAILASSLLEKLHDAFPDASLTMLVRRGNESIYAGHPYLREVLVWDKKSQKLANLFRLIRRIRSSRYDCVVNGHRYASSGLLTALSGARHTAGFKENPFSFTFNFTARHKIGDGRHEVARLQSLVADICKNAVFRPRLYPSAEHRNSTEKYSLTPFVCMAPASVWFTKQLPIEKWIELCINIPADRKIYLLGSAEDIALCERIATGSKKDNIAVLAGKLSLLESCSLMERAEMNFVNDSAPLHLASSVNAPVTAFFCSTVPRFGFGPMSDKAQVVGVDNLACRPCGLHGYQACPLGHFKCGHLMPIPGPTVLADQ